MMHSKLTSLVLLEELLAIVMARRGEHLLLETSKLIQIVHLIEQVVLIMPIEKSSSPLHWGHSVELTEKHSRSSQGGFGRLEAASGTERASGEEC